MVHWIAFALFGFVGGKMIYEFFKLKQAKKPTDILSTAVILLLSLVTGIDALAVGVTLFLFFDSLACNSGNNQWINNFCSFIRRFLYWQSFWSFFRDRHPSDWGVDSIWNWV